MAFVTATKNGRYEIRESRNTPDGPRSRTLASFKELDEETIEKAVARAESPLDAEQVRRAALRVGAPVAPNPVDRAARELLGRLAKGEQVSPMVRRLLLAALENPDSDALHRPAQISDAARSASEWINAGPDERGEALEDLLRLTDAVPVRRRPQTIGFPRLSSRAA
jgi:hypothetical protein